MEEKQARDFTNIRSNKFLSRCLSIVLFVFMACSSDPSDDPIPFQPFPSLIIDLTLPSNNALQTLGWKYFNDVGVRGIIVYKVNSTTYLAYERNCSFQPNDACATVDVHSSNLYMIDACCNSAFNFSNGAPTSGPAWRNLLQYATSLNGSMLTVTDDIIQ